LDERFFLVYFAAFPIARFDSHARIILPLGDDARFARDAGEEASSPASLLLHAEEKVSGMCPV
jgi:hypothetical protein